MSNPTQTQNGTKYQSATRPVTTTGSLVAAASVSTVESTAAPAAPPPEPSAAPTKPFTGLASWQAPPEMRRRALVCRLEELKADIPDAVVRMLRRNLRDVDHLLVGRSDDEGRRRAQGLREWFTGARIEAVWQTLHEVERALVTYRPRKDLEGSLAGIIADAEKCLPPTNRSLGRVVRWSRTAPKDLDELRSGVRDLLEQTHLASDAFHESARRLRNGMLGITVATVVSIVAVLALQAGVSTIELVPAPDGFNGPPWVLLAFVMLAGALGAFITAVPTTIRASSGGLPYRLPIQQRMLKLAVGPLLAVVGVMFVAGGLVGTMTMGGMSQLLALAVVFGSAQQAITAFADKSAGDLLAPKDAS